MTVDLIEKMYVYDYRSAATNASGQIPKGNSET